MPGSKSKLLGINIIIYVLKSTIKNKTFKYFERAGVFKIGLISVISLGALHLGIGVTNVCLKINGKTPSIKHWLKIAVKGVDKR